MVAKIEIANSFMDTIDDLDAETVLCGPDRDPGDTVIDPIMAATFDSAVEDFCMDTDVEIDRSVLLQAVTTPLDRFTNEVLARQDPIATFKDPIRGVIVPAIGKDGTDFGVLALKERFSEPGTYKISGLFSGSTLCVDEMMRRHGIGEALVITRLLRDGELPTWHHDKPGYSPAGAATVEKALDSLKGIISALRNGTEMPETATRLSLNLHMKEPSPCP